MIRFFFLAAFLGTAAVGAQVPTPVPVVDSLAGVNQRWVWAGTTPYVDDERARLAAAPAPHPGYYHCGTGGNFRYCPCDNTPYVQWTDPETQHVGYWRYDYTPYLYSGASGCGLQLPPCIDGQGGPNHTQQGYGFPLNYLIPLEPQPDVNNYYPVPEADTGLGTIWALFNTPPPTFPGSNCAALRKSNPVFNTAWLIKRPQVNADPGCQSGPPATPTVTPTPTPTPTPAPNIYADWIEAAVNQHYMSSCGPNLFCPGSSGQINAGYVTRAQEAVFLMRSVHGVAYVPPACEGIFTDVPCGGH